MWTLLQCWHNCKRSRISKICNLFKNLVLTLTLRPHKPSRRWTWHSPDRMYHNQIVYILVRKQCLSGVNVHKTRGFPGADIKSDHDLVMMTFPVRLKKTIQSRQRFNLEKLRNPDVAGTFQETIGGTFAHLINLRDDDINIDSMITTYNTAVTDTVSEMHWKECRRNKPWDNQGCSRPLWWEEGFEEEAVWRRRNEWILKC